MKYIPAEKLIAEIERLYDEHSSKYEIDEAAIVLDKLEDFIASLQQEQPMPDSTKLIELWHEDKEMLKEKDFRDDPWRLAYNAFMCGFGRGLAVKQQEQPEVDLEGEVEKYFGDYWKNYPLLVQRELINFARTFVAKGYILAKGL